MAVLLPAQNLLYLAEPHTGSSAVAKVLLELGGQWLGPHHATLDHLVATGQLSETQRGELTILSTVRNHFDLLVTWWLRRGQKNSFRHFVWLLTTVPAEETGSAFEVVRDGELFWRHADASDRLLRHESLQSNLDGVLSEHGVDDVHLPRLFPTPGKAADYRVYYDDFTRTVVERTFSAELRRYGYAFDDAESWLGPRGPQPPSSRT